MADAYTTILRKTDPFVLDKTVESLESISSGSNYPLPLGSTAKSGDTDEDRPYLHTPFNKIDNSNYKSPWKASKSSDADIVELEQTANEVWDAYRQLYYGHDAIGSVFVRRKGGDAKKGGVLEALFGIQKVCLDDAEEDEISRWESVHTVTIEVPNFDEKTCEYAIQSAVWCRYKPEDVGDVPTSQRPKKAEAPKKKKAFSPKKLLSKLDVARLEVFDKAANNWDSKGNRKLSEPIQTGEPLAPVPAVVTSSAVYTKDTTKVCKLSLAKTAKSIPVASHIQNIGSLIEKIEADIRSKLERVDAPKCVEVLQAMYRPTLSPGLKLPSDSGPSMISKLGGHATGMGVGKGLIGEIALKAKSKGLGGGAANEESSTNKAMEHILANEKKKLQEPSKAPSTWNQSGLKKSEAVQTAKDMAADAAGFLKQAQLRKAAPRPTAIEPSTPAPTPEFMNFRSKLKSTAAK